MEKDALMETEGATFQISAAFIRLLNVETSSVQVV